MPPSIKRLRVICQRDKLRRPDDLTRRHRAISIYATWLLVRTDVTADQVTIASIVTGLAGAVALGASGLACGTGGVALLYVSFLLDQVDGEVARFRRRTSLRGVYLDELRHLVIYAAPVFALAFSVHRSTGSTLPFVAGFVGALALALARVEERLPALIFGERASTIVVAPSHAPSPAHAETRPRGARAAWVRLPLRGIHAAYEALTHQVLILIWFLVAVIGARGLGFPSLEGALLVSLAATSALSLLATIVGRARPGAIEADVIARAARARLALSPRPEEAS